MEGLLRLWCAAFRSGARKGRLASAEEPNGACRPRGKLSLVKLDSTTTWRLEKAPKNYTKVVYENYCQLFVVILELTQIIVADTLPMDGISVCYM